MMLAMMDSSKSAPARYTGTYADASGMESIVLENDGAEIRVRIRGQDFSGSDFDGLTPVAEEPPPGFVFSAWKLLCACTFEFDMPVPVVADGGQVGGMLRVCLALGKPDARNAIDSETIQLTLSYTGLRFISSGKSGWFEEALEELQKQMPPGDYLKACFSCLHSDYSVYGQPAFGGMLCWRDTKEAYLAAKTKEEYACLKGPALQVQETWLCPQFTRRVPGTGYRG